MKKNIILSAAIMLSATAFADDFNLYYDSYAGDAGIKIEDGKIVAFTADGKTQTIPTSDIKRLFFSTEKTVVGIEEVTENGMQNQVDKVYDLTGRKVNIDLQKGKLPKGMYIVNGKKILVK